MLQSEQDSIQTNNFKAVRLDLGTDLRFLCQRVRPYLALWTLIAERLPLEGPPSPLPLPLSFPHSGWHLAAVLEEMQHMLVWSPSGGELWISNSSSRVSWGRVLEGTWHCAKCQWSPAGWKQSLLSACCNDRSDTALCSWAAGAHCILFYVWFLVWVLVCFCDSLWGL